MKQSSHEPHPNQEAENPGANNSNDNKDKIVVIGGILDSSTGKPPYKKISAKKETLQILKPLLASWLQERYRYTVVIENGYHDKKEVKN